MSLGCKGIFIVGAKRTPFCKHGGALRDLPAYQPFAAAAKAAMQTAKLEPSLVDNTVVGNVHFLSQCDGGKTPRYCGIYSGVPLDRPALGVGKACGTGLQAVVCSALDILTGAAKISLAGGTELMSALPLLVRNVRFGTSLAGSYIMEDHIPKEFPDSFVGVSLQRIAEDMAKKYGITRREVDEFALQSHLKWKKAQETGVFADELTPITVTIKKKEVTIDTDDVTQDLSLADLEAVPPLLDQGSVVTAANSAPPADGAAALLLATESSLQHGPPLARLAGWARVGVDPAAGLGAVAAVERLLGEQKLAVGDVDLFEINETFPSQVLVAARLLGLDGATVNTAGGALALGHPAAATGARMVAHLAHQMNRRKVKRAIATSSCGGGQGIAVLLESV